MVERVVHQTGRAAVDSIRAVADRHRHRPGSRLLELDLTQPLLDHDPADRAGRLMARRRTSLPTLLTKLAEASADDSIAGLIVKLGPARMSLARAQEIRDAIGAFRAAGKPAYAWAETFGEFEAATVTYLLATAFDEIWLQPSGDVGLVGVAATSLFFAEALDRLGVQRQIGTRYEYKNAANMFTERSFTPAQREATGRLVESAFEQVVAGVAAGRGVQQDAVRSLIEQAPLTAHEAESGGLVDRLGYRDEVYEDVLSRTTPAPDLLFVDRYRPRHSATDRVRRAVVRRRGVVALVSGSGAIRLGRSGRGPLPGAGMGSDTVGAALRAAGRDDRVRAVVFRINSPGGSYVASDTIWREVGRLRDAGKPVIVSMSDVAASGGYFVAAPADVIVAEPGTITGSIGVLGGKASVGELTQRWGITHGAITAGRRARMMSALEPFTDDEWQRLSGWLDQIYDDFVGKVAAGRNMTVEAVHEVARGRVWTGLDAHARGLVDELGGLRRASEIARERARLAADAPLVPYPHRAAIRRLRPPRSSDQAEAGALLFDAWGPVNHLAYRLGLPTAGPLLMPAFTTPILGAKSR